MDIFEAVYREGLAVPIVSAGGRTVDQIADSTWGMMTAYLPRALSLLVAVVLAACGSAAPPTASLSPSHSATPDLPTGSPAAFSPSPPTSVPTTTSLSPSPPQTLGPIPSLALSPTPSAVETPTPSGTFDPTETPSTTPPTLPPGPLADAFAEQLATILEQQQTALRIPGLSASVVFPDDSRWETAEGFADLGREIPATTDTTFVVGSITKTFVAAATLQLAEEGVLALDDPLSDWVPDYPDAENITVIQLLSHTSGLYDYFQHPEYNLRVFNEPDHEWTPREILDEFVLEPYFAPGTDYHYSNTNFILAGLVVQRAADKPLAEVLSERFFEPLGLDETWSQAAGPPPAEGSLGCLVQQRGTVCLDDGTAYRPTKGAATVAWGAGDIVSTAPDLADWARDVYGGDVLATESLARITDYEYSSYARGAYALGTRTRLFGEYRMFGHTGSLRGFSAAMWYFPNADLTIVVLTNRGRIDVNPVVDALAAPIVSMSELVASE